MKSIKRICLLSVTVGVLLTLTACRSLPSVSDSLPSDTTGSVTESVTEPVKESATEPVTESATESATGSDSGPAKEPVTEPFATPSVFVDRYLMQTGRTTVFYTADFFPCGTGGGFVTYRSSADGFAVTADGFSVTPAAAGAWELSVTVADVSGQVRMIHTVILEAVAPRRDACLTGLIIGDSRVSDGTIVNLLSTRFEGQIDLIGTKKTSAGYCHEGRSAWKALQYLTSPEVTVLGKVAANPFFNPLYTVNDESSGVTSHFDFEYYLTQTGYEVPDFIVICLGANDGYSTVVADYLRLMTDNIQSVSAQRGKNVTVIVLTEYFCAGDGYSGAFNSADLDARRARQTALNLALIETFANREEEGILLLPCYAVIGDPTDRPTDPETGRYTDTVHLSIKGYTKEARMLFAYLHRYVAGVI